jgi:hypothetical protein
MEGTDSTFLREGREVGVEANIDNQSYIIIAYFKKRNLALATIVHDG